MYHKPRHYKKNKSRKLPNTDPYQSILNLNDDCLSEIFTYLPLQDLSNIALTCSRIQEIANKAFPRFANLNAKHFLTKNRYNLTTERKMGIIIKQLAQHVKSFEISSNIIDENFSQRSTELRCETLIRLILSHCHNITDLKIGYRIDRFSQEIFELENFQKLETIDIYTTNYNLKGLSRLKNLQLTSFKNIIASELLMLKNLDSLCLNFYKDMDSNLFSQICDNNPNIKRIELQVMSAAIIDLIVDKLVHLEDITIPLHITEDVKTKIMRISEIKYLKRFKSDRATELLAKLAELDQLESITYCTYYNQSSIAAELIAKFTNLKYLCVTSFTDPQLNSLKSQRTLEHVNLDNSKVTDEGIVNFVEGAINLKYLSLCGCTFCDEHTLDALQDLVRKSNRKQKLTVHCDFIHECQIKDYPLLNISWHRYREQISSFNCYSEYSS